MPYRDRATGTYPVSRAELVAEHPNTSFPATWNQPVLDFLEVDEVFPVPPPATEPGFAAVEGQPELTPKGTWQQTWEIVEVETPPPPPEPVPPIVSRFQARAAMMLSAATDGESENLLVQMDAMVAGQPDPMVKLAWAEAVEWRRDSPSVNGLAQAAGLSDEDLDNLFRAAAGIIA
jgi:hypothetical protein